MKKLVYGLLISSMVSNAVLGRGFGGYNRNNAKSHQSVSSPLLYREYSTNNPLSIFDCFNKVCEIEYVPDEENNDYWQSPLETLNRNKGDCEDLSFYLFYLLKKNGYRSRVVAGYMDNNFNNGHMWVEYNGNNETCILDPAVKKMFNKSVFFNQVPRRDYIEYEPRLGFQRDIINFIRNFKNNP